MSAIDEFKNQSHPSYAVIRFNKIHNGVRALFGSSIKHSDLISLEIEHAELDRGLHKDWIHPTTTILRALMSYSQFAEAITSFGQGGGVPITLEYLYPDGSIEETPFQGKIDQFEKEFQDQLQANAQTAKDAKNTIAEILNKKSIGKGDRDTIIKLLDSVVTQTVNNTSFVYRSFNEQMDKTISEAKGEIEAYIQNKMDSLAAKAVAAGINIEDTDFTLKLDEKE